LVPGPLDLTSLNLAKPRTPANSTRRSASVFFQTSAHLLVASEREEISGALLRKPGGRVTSGLFSENSDTRTYRSRHGTVVTMNTNNVGRGNDETVVLIIDCGTPKRVKGAPRQRELVTTAKPN
jgi:hypothetical protein